jgi:hypothetical protein
MSDTEDRAREAENKAREEEYKAQEARDVAREAQRAVDAERTDNLSDLQPREDIASGERSNQYETTVSHREPAASHQTPAAFQKPPAPAEAPASTETSTPDVAQRAAGTKAEQESRAKSSKS